MANPDEEPYWIRWTGKSRFARECREGDSIIRIWRSSKAHRPSAVLGGTGVLLKQQAANWTRFYLRPSDGRRAEMSWGKFQLLLKQVGVSKRVGPGSVLLLEPDIAEAIARKWKSAAK
jgi:hypothetical protein